MEQEIRLEGVVRPDDALRDPYMYLPFSVPARTTRLHVSYDYTEPVTAPFGLGPGNRIDIGIFDPRGAHFLEAPGFRGWSGSSKKQFFIAPHEATPGYIRGPLFPGEWNLMLGFERVQEDGVRYDVRVGLTVADREAPDADPAATLPDAVSPAGRKPRQSGGKGRFVKGDLHCHTVHSDGLNTVEDLARNAIERGLDFLAVTDHNTNTHHEDITRLSRLPILLIPGEEVTTYWGHANMWGLRDWVEFRCPDAESMQKVQRFVLQKGGLISVNHPKSVGPPWLFEQWSGYPCMEVWQAPWRFYNWESLERWDLLLRRGERVVAVGGSDVHSIPPAPPMHPHGLGNPTTWVYVEGPLTEDAVLDGIRQGHVFLSDDPPGPQLILTADADGDGRFEKMMGDTVEAGEGQRVSFRVRAIGGAGRKLWLVCDGFPLDIIPLNDVDSVYNFSLELSGRTYIRAELRGLRGRPERGEVIWAMTNPIWLNSDG
ncbi:MAG: PHP domain-containing protein [Chloroflexi bacterium]|nr:PHP domain-containing protein [Chloroflexota bacterium]